jgi:hypothetical protein
MNYNWRPALFKPPEPCRWFELGWPLELDAKQVSAWLQALSGQYSSKGIRFVVTATAGDIKHHLVLPESNYRLHIQLINTFLPDIELIEVEPLTLKPKLSAKLLLTSRSRVLQTKDPLTTAQATLSSLAALSGTEQVTLSWVLGKRISPKEIYAEDKIKSSENWLRSILEAFLYGPTKLDGPTLKS